jgi:hypothetical protein
MKLLGSTTEYHGKPKNEAKLFCWQANWKPAAELPAALGYQSL